MIDRAFAPAANAVAEGRIPGAALGLVHADGRREVRHAGMAALVPTPEPLTQDHWFDLASLTKVIATTTIILTLAEQGQIELDRPLTDADLNAYVDGALAPARVFDVEQALAKERGEAQDISFGSQIRSYVLHPYTMVNDHRTNVKIGNAQAVLDGDLDGLIHAYLLSRAAGRG